jgi:hypothetical protein
MAEMEPKNDAYDILRGTTPGRQRRNGENKIQLDHRYIHFGGGGKMKMAQITPNDGILHWPKI